MNDDCVCFKGVTLIYNGRFSRGQLMLLFEGKFDIIIEI